VDLANGTVTNSFSTASFADADGLPETAMMRFYEDKLYIACQLLDRGAWYAPTGSGTLLVFDTIIEQWVDMDADVSGIQPISLYGANPYTDLFLVQEEGSDTQLYLGCVGYYGMTDGGVERVNLDTGISAGIIVSEDDLGGDLTRLTKGEAGLYAIVADAGFNTGLKFINETDGGTTLIAQGSGFVFSDMAVLPGNLVFLADRTVGNSGVRVFDALTFTELTTSPVSSGLPPSQFVVDLSRDENVSAIIPDLAGHLHVGAPFPNPCNPAAIFPVMGLAGTHLSVQILDLRGYCLKTERLILDENGIAEFRFKGVDSQGRDLSAGQYRIVFQGEQSWSMRSVTLIK